MSDRETWKPLNPGITPNTRQRAPWWGFQTSHLSLRDLDGEWFELLADCIYVTKDGERVEVPAGFFTDFASIPRVFWRLAPKSGKHNRAAVIHDWLCEMRPYTVARTSAIFLEALEACGVGVLRRRAMWAAVRMFGPKWDATFESSRTTGHYAEIVLRAHAKAFAERK